MRRTIAVAAVLFVLILAFLAGRVHAGADPSQAAAPASRTVDTVPTPTPAAPDAGGSPYGGDDYGTDPNGGLGPDQGTVPSPGGQDFDPPTTQAS